MKQIQKFNSYYAMTNAVAVPTPNVALAEGTIYYNKIGSDIISTLYVNSPKLGYIGLDGVFVANGYNIASEFFSVRNGDTITFKGVGVEDMNVISFYTDDDESTYVEGMHGLNPLSVQQKIQHAYSYTAPDDGYIRIACSCSSNNTTPATFTTTNNTYPFLDSAFINATTRAWTYSWNTSQRRLVDALTGLIPILKGMTVTFNAYAPTNTFAIAFYNSETDTLAIDGVLGESVSPNISIKEYTFTAPRNGFVRLGSVVKDVDISEISATISKIN